MAEESYPRQGHNSRQVTDTEHELLAARFSDDGVYGDPTDTQVVTAGTGLSVNIRADVAASVRGHGWYSGSTPFSVSLPANVASQARTDWIVLRLDRSDWTVTAAVVGGTPGSGAPALRQQTGDTGIWEIPLAQARVLGGASSVTVTRAEQYVGTRCRPCTSTTRNPYPRLGEQCFERDTKRLMLWDGSAWQVVYQDSGEISLQTVSVSGWAVDGESIVQIKNGSAHVRLGAFRRTSASASGVETRLPIVLPTACQPPRYWQYPLVYLTGARLGRLTVYNSTHARAGQVWLTEHPALAVGEYIISSTTSWAV